MTNNITAILTGYRRPEFLAEQYNAVKNQSIPPLDIMYWQNTDEHVDYDAATIGRCISAVGNRNLGVWSRFAYALNARTDYVCIFDDDTIPGSKWFENCLATQKEYPGLHGTIGVIFGGSEYHNVHRIGWDNPNILTTKVDIVGHSWFFPRWLLSAFWRELPPIDQAYTVGEDIHFSHMIQKYAGLSTWVPPHPSDDLELWGSLKGWQYGNDGRATASTSMHLMDENLKRAIDNGFILIEP